MSLREHLQLLNDSVSRLLSDLPSVPTDDHNAIRHYIDHNEFVAGCKSLNICNEGMFVSAIPREESPWAQRYPGPSRATHAI
jgi:hypothetical protein